MLTNVRSIRASATLFLGFVSDLVQA